MAGPKKKRLASPLALFLCGAVVATAATGTAAKLITGKDIKDGSVAAKDLAPAVRAKLARVGATGPAGPVGRAGATGAAGLPGQNGAQGVRGLSAWDTIPSGQTVTGGKRFVVSPAPAGGSTYEFTVDLPGRAPVALTDATVNFSLTGSTATADDTTSCGGTPAAPTAPPGFICLYHVDSEPGTAGLVGNALVAAPTRGFNVLWQGKMGGGDNFVEFSWAYTAP
jgi:hypothetical protein